MQDIGFKEQVLQSRGKPVSLDYFLFSCYETDRTLRAKGVQEVEGWTILGSATPESIPSELQSNDFWQILESMFSWYKYSYTPMTETLVLDYEQLPLVVPPFVRLFQDIGKVHQLKLSGKLPEFSNSSGSVEFYQRLEDLLKKFFPGYYRFFMQFFSWANAQVIEEEFIPGSRPPVGKYAPRFDRGPRKGGGDRGGATSRPQGGNGRSSGPRDRGGRGEGFGRKNEASFRGERNERGGNRGGRERSRGKGRDRDQERGKDPKAEEAALKDVMAAIKTMKSKPELNEFKLNPANSFFRRMQHRIVSENGLFSTSIGEGPDRALKLVREPSGSQEGSGE